MRTYQSLYKNERRAVEITINDEDGASFITDGASAAIYDGSGTVVVAEQAAYTDSNKIYTIVGTTTTANIGKYKIVWKLIKDTYIYYHSTDLTVQEL